MTNREYVSSLHKAGNTAFYYREKLIEHNIGEQFISDLEDIILSSKQKVKEFKEYKEKISGFKTTGLFESPYLMKPINLLSAKDGSYLYIVANLLVEYTGKCTETMNFIPDYDSTVYNGYKLTDWVHDIEYACLNPDVCKLYDFIKSCDLNTPDSRALREIKRELLKFFLAKGFSGFEGLKVEIE